jgi:SAM-dependent methyltransferase
MPYSSTEGKDWMAAQITAHASSIARVLDVGAGCGTYFDLAAKPGQAWWAVEVWPANVDRFDLPSRYDVTSEVDIRGFNWPAAAFDVVIFGDVLEHMPRVDALAVWAAAREHSHHILLSIPVVPYPQGPEEGNPYEEHVETWTHEECMALPGVVAHQLNPTIGCYLAEGLR